MAKVFLAQFLVCLSVVCMAEKSTKPIFEDDFTDSRTIEAKWGGVSGPFEFQDGMALQLCDVGKSQARAYPVAKDFAWNDYEVSAKVKIINGGNGGHAGIAVRKTNDGKSVYILMTGDGKSVGVNGIGPLKTRELERPTSALWHELRITCVQSRITVYLDGNQEFDLLDVPWENGSVGLFTHKIDAAFKDFTIKALAIPPPAPEGEIVNIINNSSFEYATVPNLPDCWGNAGWGLTEDRLIGQLDELWNKWGRDTENPFDGKYSMRINTMNMLESTIFNPNPGFEYTFSAWMRADKKGTPVKVDFANWKATMWEKEFPVTEQWSRYSWTLPKVESNECVVNFIIPAASTVWVDAVQLTRGKELYAYRPDNFSGGKVNVAKDAKVPQIVPVKLENITRNGKGLVTGMLQHVPVHALKTANGDTPQEATEFKLAYDDANIYLWVKCYDSKMDKISKKIKGRDGHVWTDDSIEIFLGPSGPRGDWVDYFHLAFNALGTRYDARKADPGWNAEWSVEALELANAWEAEVTIPFASLELNPFNKGDWTFNVCRENNKSKEWSCWSPTHGNFHKSEYFGIIKAFQADVLEKWIKVQSKTTENGDFTITPLVVDGEKFMGFGLVWMSTNFQPGENAFMQMEKAEMNLLVWVVYIEKISEKEMRNVLKLGEKHSIKIIPCLLHGKPLVESGDELYKNAAAFITKYKNERSIIAWCLLDEPHTNPEKLLALYDAAKKADPQRPAFINFTPQGIGMRLAGIPGDMVSVDRYTIFFDGSVIADIDSTLKQARKETLGRPRPLNVFLQGMSNCLWVWRGPTPEEHTAQTYTALVNGASLISYFSGIIMPRNTWERTRTLSAEIKILKPIIFANEPADITCSNEQIKYMARFFDNTLYIVAVNPFNKKIACAFDMTAESKGGGFKAKRLFETSPVGLNGMLLEDKFAPYERHCYEIEIVK